MCHNGFKLTYKRIRIHNLKNKDLYYHFQKTNPNKIPPAGTGGIFSSLMKLSLLINFYILTIP